MKLDFNLYYFCKLEKKSATIEKIRRFCSKRDCPHLGVRKRKNKFHQKKNNKEL